MAEYGNESGPDDSRQQEAMRKMFIGGLNRDTTEDAFRDFFQQFGSIEDSVIIRDPNSQMSRGFGFVTYENSDSVQEVFKSRPHNLEGKTVDCKRAMPREFNTPSSHSKTTRLFVGGFKGFDLEPAELQEYIESRHPREFGTVEKIDFLKDKESGFNKGFGFIDTSDPDFADRLAISENSFNLKGRKLSIKKAEPKDGSGDGQRGGRGGSRRGNNRNDGGGRQGGYNQGGNNYNQGGNNYSQGGSSYNQNSYGSGGGGGGYNNSYGGGNGYNNQGGGYGNNTQSYGSGGSQYGSGGGQYGSGGGQYGGSGYSNYGGASQQQTSSYGGAAAGGYSSGGYQQQQSSDGYSQGGYDSYNQKSTGGGSTRGGRGRYQPY